MTSKLFFQSILLCLSFLMFNAYAADCVILLHGLARTDASMSKLEKKLLDEGYSVINSDYPSRKYKVETLAESVIPAALEKCESTSNVHFVTHSMGGILVRQYLSKHKIKRLKYTVMLGPPNQGSEVVDTLSGFPGFSMFNGPAGMQLGTGEMSVPRKLGPVKFPVGIIAGTKSINLILSTMLPEPNDGKVSVESTKVEGMADHISLPVTHPLMMKNNKVIEQVLFFLKNGMFKKSEASIKSKFAE